MRWRLTHRFDPVACGLADRHYSRQKIGSPQCVAPGSCVVLLAADPAAAMWVSLRQRFVKHAWPDAWNCTLFRNEGVGLSSELITEAVSATRAHWRPVPSNGFITFVDPSKVKHKRDPGRCFVRAGWRRIGETAKGLVVFGLRPDDFPAPQFAHAGPLFASQEDRAA